jgi:hypothetical protein
LVELFLVKIYHFYHPKLSVVHHFGADGTISTIALFFGPVFSHYCTRLTFPTFTNWILEVLGRPRKLKSEFSPMIPTFA